MPRDAPGPPIAPCQPLIAPGSDADQRPRVLVVDDERVDRTLAYHAATRAGCAATAVAGVAEASRLLGDGHAYDFIILDLSLGTDDGLEIMPALASMATRPSLIFSSGFDSRVLAASQRLATSLGLRVAGVLRKPIFPAALRNLLALAPKEKSAEPRSAQAIDPLTLRQAVANRQIEAWFQPKISLATGAVIGAEALARWTMPDGRFVRPVEFIGMTERLGLVGALTDAMLDQSLKACARWRVLRPDCSVAVNISPSQLDDPTLTDRIDERLRRHDVPPGGLIVEITEDKGIPDTPLATQTLTRLRIRGVHLAVDDFGTGHSGLLSLVRMPFNELKIDQAFVRESPTDGDSRKVVRASASLGRELGLLVTAEGVETAPIASFVREAGCHIGQGWLYGRAVPPETFETQFLADPKPLAQAAPA